MKILFTFLLTLISSSSIAQPILTKHLQYNTGDSYTHEGCENCDTTGISAAMATGPNHTWNLTFKIQGSGTIAFVNKYQSNSGVQFPDANLVRHWIGSITYTFLQKTATELRYVANEINGSPSVTFSPYRREEVWPFTYNDSFVDSVSASFPQTSIKGFNFYSNIADGYGTLIVNGKTYTNVLRTFTKSESVELSMHPIETIERIRWWDTAHKTALLEIRHYESSTGNSYAAYILKQETLVGIKDLTNRYANITAHTQNGQLYLDGELETGKEYQLHLYNSTGQRIISQTFIANGQQFSTPVPDITTGVYYIHLQRRGDAPGYIKFLHQ